ncbi:centromere protein P isoform X3 [Colius striatus]|uniref:centromere protein P isoform X3 n=1 Tax=Colius striatus TaxID=57412 RepID=UPI002B1DA138|nr:centromere protein P isoform X3 [Colius striatus]
MDNSVCQFYEDEIQSLEEEIKLLTEKYEDSQQEANFFSDEMLMAMKSFQREFQRESKENESSSDLKAQLESLEKDLSFLMKCTGIQFMSHSKKTVEKTRNRTRQKHRLSGNCYSLSFQLEFQLLEMQSKENISTVITDLSIVMESGEDSDVSKFVSSTEERGDLLMFFRSLSSYAEWYEHRRCTFLHFKTCHWRTDLMEIMTDWIPRTTLSRTIGLQKTSSSYHCQYGLSGAHWHHFLVLSEAV